MLFSNYHTNQFNIPSPSSSSCSFSSCSFSRLFNYQLIFHCSAGSLSVFPPFPQRLRLRDCFCYAKPASFLLLFFLHPPPCSLVFPRSSFPLILLSSSTLSFLPPSSSCSFSSSFFSSFFALLKQMAVSAKIKR